VCTVPHMAYTRNYNQRLLSIFTFHIKNVFAKFVRNRLFYYVFVLSLLCVYFILSLMLQFDFCNTKCVLTAVSYFSSQYDLQKKSTMCWWRFEKFDQIFFGEGVESHESKDLLHGTAQFKVIKVWSAESWRIYFLPPFLPLKFSAGQRAFSVLVDIIQPYPPGEAPVLHWIQTLSCSVPTKRL